MKETYSYYNPSNGYIGHYETPEQAAEAGFKAMKKATEVYVMKNTLATARKYVSCVSVSELLTCVAEKAYDDVSSGADMWLSAIAGNKAKCEELAEIIANWIQENDPPTFTTPTLHSVYNKGDKK